MNAKVSVIIPVFNAEKYLTQCIESLLAQTLQDCEFIFVNDGSKDHSQQIIEEVEKRDPRVKLINQVNQGVSIARNNGLRVATGEYIGFVDADDYIEADMYEQLYSVAKQNNCDVVISNFESEIDGHKVITRYSFPIIQTLDRKYIELELLPYFLKNDNLNTACNKIYKTKIAKENKVLFPKRVTLGEDGLFNIRFFSFATKAVYVDYTGYHYREVEGSATRNIEEKDYFERALEVYKSDLLFDILGDMSKEKIIQLKSIKLIQSVMAYIHIYFKPSKVVNFKTRYRYIKNMISNKSVRESVPFYYSENYNMSGRYEKFILNMIKRRSILGLYCAVTYSRLRNK
ncbi:glycosyltransferase [Halalkalibacter alkalisediminis]|uniref:Glycosyltransferase n=1 Tax=Halalkalibacter alkalisediminis TaxID=935616 RepID=A0ABV6NH29_9BACI|nr:glycosyltransferase [Halalkalibacter alkalisediminis]